MKADIDCEHAIVAAALDYARDGILLNCVLPGAVSGKVRFHPDTNARIQAGKLTGPGTDVERRRPLGWGNAQDIAAAKEIVR